LLHSTNTQCLLLNHVHRHIVCSTHIQPHGIPHHAIHASTADIQHIHLHPVYTIQCIHLYPMCNTTQYMYLHRVQHNEYTRCNAMTTWCTYIISYSHNIALMACTQYHTYTSTICTTCTQYHLYTAPPAQCVHNVTCTCHRLHNVYTMPHVHYTTIQCVHSIIYTQHYISNIYIAPYAHMSHIHHEDSTICIQHPICNIHTTLFVPSCT